MMYVVPKKANDMMNVGMLEGYTVKKSAYFIAMCVNCMDGFALFSFHTVFFSSPG